ncbi:hypothetical protein EDB81DRAFT_808390 [Dactylonectria macrodidyma]|uniref:Zn(2)-C6 fungal-type domain-containing protein n=1 Tax=Dactylonectria macrodidyma TaxID=307937 RepID=A0A9P9IT09_9HYPO|nr:hypothetical protein EDB81DRAFT_808390 [Dactylonectria macrodidyma]
MRATLRRSCDACAKAKHGCDLRTPRCSRCIKRGTSCVYTNEPLTSSSKTHTATSTLAVQNEEDMLSLTRGDVSITSELSDNSAWTLDTTDGSFDPFDSYPPTRLPRVHVQRLIWHFLTSIAFQYYPLDLNMESNPFVVSWWPLCLADPALFHVSLQTASLDEELRAQKGFPLSELLMMDSVSLVRRKIEDPSEAFHDETLNSVVTLAAIEHGKRNIEASRMHIDGVKQMVSVRGGINQLKSTSPLTARMVSWVSMLVTGAPQFSTQDDFGFGDGIGQTLQWRLALTPLENTFDDYGIDPIIVDTLTRLRNIFHQPQLYQLTNTELHDLVCFVMHKLLQLPPLARDVPQQAAISECLRYAMALFMLMVHGTTYYSHAALASIIVSQLKVHITALADTDYVYDSLGIWVLSVGMVATIGTVDHQWFKSQARMAVIALGLCTWADILIRLKSILWLRTPHEELCQKYWEEILTSW